MLLLSLGSDYNVFVVGRIWHEARTRPLADAVAVAVPDAAKPVTLAGLVLAGSFALLALAPVVALRQLAVALSSGRAHRRVRRPVAARAVADHEPRAGRRLAGQRAAPPRRSAARRAGARRC